MAVLVRTFLLQPFYIPSGSMENTLHVGDRVLVDKLSYRLGDIDRGDVVVFDGLDSFTSAADLPAPEGNALQRGLDRVTGALGLGPSREKDFIKRVIGLPGDRVQGRPDGKVYVNGVALDESEYLHPGDRGTDVTFDVVVPEGRLWVMGDHRSDSVDSRGHLGDPGGGTVPEDRVIGRAVSVIWPLTDLGGLGRPDTFTDIPPALATTGGSTPYSLDLGALAPGSVLLVLSGQRRRGPRRLGDGGRP